MTEEQLKRAAEILARQQLTKSCLCAALDGTSGLFRYFNNCHHLLSQDVQGQVIEKVQTIVVAILAAERDRLKEEAEKL